MYVVAVNQSLAVLSRAGVPQEELRGVTRLACVTVADTLARGSWPQGLRKAGARPVTFPSGPLGTGCVLYEVSPGGLQAVRHFDAQEGSGAGRRRAYQRPDGRRLIDVLTRPVIGPPGEPDAAQRATVKTRTHAVAVASGVLSGAPLAGVHLEATEARTFLAGLAAAASGTNSRPGTAAFRS
ncbi:hypothetical protein STVIR_3915 [Streptomyces viridochromogenes Tue57]|uniref:Uncharacterized protein n=1 Tax=Streptomyces viridochromogenes Tue57 TaxID=1160705 RepID=L8PG21_STRVR|nr:hypothetical protein STVIR_3915 [Streptomyces viridochromogenes Tue57]